jgi:hypothetical protein
MQVIETKDDAVKYLQEGKKASDILLRLDQLSVLLGSPDSEDEDAMEEEIS